MAPPRKVEFVVHDGTQDAEDLDVRTGWQKNSKAIGVVFGTAMATFVAGAGGAAGLAHMAHLATTADIAALKEEMGGIVRAQQASDKVDGEAFKKLNEQLAAIAADTQATRADVLRRLKKVRP